MLDNNEGFGPAEPDDLMMIGTFLHTYTFMELNLHRAVRLFRKAGSLSERESRRPAASDLPQLVLKGSASLSLSASDQSTLKDCLHQIELRQPFRNLLAHWALRRLPGTDILVFVTMDERDAKLIGGDPPEYNDLFYALAFGADLRGLSLHISPYGVWLAEHVSGWQQELFPKV